ncbi:unnamed protein product [Discosporangium mesarthrocarpum]
MLTGLASPPRSYSSMVLILMSPAKTLNWTAAPSALSSLWSKPSLLGDADPVGEVLRGKSRAELKKLMSVSDAIASLNHDRYQKFLPSDRAVAKADGDEFRPAALAFDGPAFKGLDAKSFTADDWVYAGKSLRLLCGLYGVLRATDLIQPYRLEMSTRVGVEGSKDLYEYWTNRVTEQLHKDAISDLQGPKREKGGSSGRKFLVVNVASQEYAKAVDLEALKEKGGEVVTCVFKDDGRVLSVFAKRARGLLASFAIRRRSSTAADLKGFNSEGYRLDPKQSGDETLVYCRSKADRPPPAPSPAVSPNTMAPKGKGKGQGHPRQVAKVEKPKAGGGEEKGLSTSSSKRKGTRVARGQPHNDGGGAVEGKSTANKRARR